MRIQYDDFTLRVDPDGEDRFRVRAESAHGEASENLSLAVTNADLACVREMLTNGWTTAHPDRSPLDAAKRIGLALYRSLFRGTVGERFTVARSAAERCETGLRLKLRLAESPSLAAIPWELLFDGHSFLALSSFTPLIRYLDIPVPVRPFPVEPPLNVLVVTSSPADLGTLDTQREFERIAGALGRLVSDDLLHLSRLYPATLAELQSELRRSSYHVLHFIGHSAFDLQANEGVLLMDDEDGYSDRVNGLRLGTILHDHPSLRLVILNSCEGASGSAADAFSSIAGGLIRWGIPAVVAMQTTVSEDAALEFATEFYAMLADFEAVETAVSEARKRLLVSGFDVEWANPVLFFRGTDGNLFSTRPYSARELVHAPERVLPSLYESPALADLPELHYEAAEYQKLATSRTPALVIYVIDTSASMAERTRSGKTRLELVTAALRASVDTMVRRSLIDSTISPRYRVAMFAYSEWTVDLLDGIRSIAEVARNGIPQLQAGLATNAAGAFIEVENLLRAEIPKIQEGPAPLVCHVTDGKFTGSDLRPYLKAIRALRVEDGNVLVSTVFVADHVLAQPIGNITRWRGICSAADLRPGYPRGMFDGSSEIPDSYRASIVEAGYDLAPRARMIFPAAYPEIVQLGVTLSAATRTL